MGPVMRGWWRDDDAVDDMTTDDNEGTRVLLVLQT